MQIYDIIIYFSIFSFAGWICETIFVTIKNKKFAYRGFLNGPVCPVYGFGGLIIVFILAPFQNNPFLLFIAGTIGTTILEYITSFLLEILFNARWWDYSNVPFNINGRVCLPFSLMFGALSLLATYVIYPPFFDIVSNLSVQIKPVLAIVLLALFIADLTITLYGLLSLNGTLRELKKASEELKKFLEELDAKGLDAKQKLQQIIDIYKDYDGVAATAKQNLSDEEADLLNKFVDKESRFKMIRGLKKLQLKRIFKAFPDLKSNKYREELKSLKSRFYQKIKKTRHD